MKERTFGEKSKEFLSKNKGKIIGGTIGASVAVAAAPIALAAAGFGAAGVVGGSFAAGVQSVIYGGFTTGVFSGLQSMGVLGLTAGATAGVGAAGASAGAAAGTMFDGEKAHSETVQLRTNSTLSHPIHEDSSLFQYGLTLIRMTKTDNGYNIIIVGTKPGVRVVLTDSNGNVYSSESDESGMHSIPILTDNNITIVKVTVSQICAR